MEDQPFFNASLERLKQLMTELDTLREYAVNDNIIGFYNNLREIRKIAKGFLTKEQIKILNRKWEELDKYKIEISDFNIRYDQELILKLHALDEWLQYTLHKNGVLYRGSEARLGGLEQIEKKYKL